MYDKHQEDTKLTQAGAAVKTFVEEAPRSQTVIKVDLIHCPSSSLLVKSRYASARFSTQLLLQTFSLHIGADLKIPTVDKRKTHVAEAQPRLSSTEKAAASDPFAGLPLKAWADRLGERVAPAFQAVQEEQRRSNLASAKMQRLNQPLAVPQVPHLFPITRW